MVNNTVDVNSVYQKVLALANKEQRGYITPQEFNYFADQAQYYIFENYFYDLKTARLKPTNDTEASDEIEILNFSDIIVQLGMLSDEKSSLLKENQTSEFPRYN